MLHWAIFPATCVATKLRDKVARKIAKCNSTLKLLKPPVDCSTYIGYAQYFNGYENSLVTGVMNPPVLVDLNKDGTVDIVMAMYNTTIAAFDGETFERMWDFVFPDSESYS